MQIGKLRPRDRRSDLVGQIGVGSHCLLLPRSWPYWLHPGKLHQPLSREVQNRTEPSGLGKELLGSPVKLAGRPLAIQEAASGGPRGR